MNSTKFRVIARIRNHLETRLLTEQIIEGDDQRGLEMIIFPPYVVHAVNNSHRIPQQHKNATYDDLRQARTSILMRTTIRKMTSEQVKNALATLEAALKMPPETMFSMTLYPIGAYG